MAKGQGAGAQAESAGVEAVFDQAFLRRLERLNLVARQLAHGPNLAERKSSHRGVSAEFAEYRRFVAGDDFRHIDWNAYARWRSLVVKLFVEEHDLPVHILVDSTASMAFGEPSKFLYARQLSAGLAWLALSTYDRVSVLPLGAAGGAGTFPPSRGKEKFVTLLRLMNSWEVASGSVNFEAAIKEWLQYQPRRGMVLWISDLWGETPEDAFRALDRLRYARQEISVVQLIDPAEGDAGSPGEFTVESVEDGRTRQVLVDQRLRREYAERYRAYQEQVQRYCRRHHLAHAQVSTATPVREVLLRSLQRGGISA